LIVKITLEGVDSWCWKCHSVRDMWRGPLLGACFCGTAVYRAADCRTAGCV